MIKKIISYFIFVTGLLFFTCCETDIKSTNEDNNTSPDSIDVFKQNELLGRGINLGNALEAPDEGDWGVTLEAGYFSTIKEVGFNSVRIPIRWSAHSTEEPPYQIDTGFFSRIDWAINLALSNDLAVIINIHHFQEIMIEPEQNLEKFLALWLQIGNHYKNYSSNLFFEVLNEPNENLTPELWNEYLLQGINTIRQSNPKRTIVVGTANWGGLSGLGQLVLPANDENIIVTFHYYEPFHFTHQGAEWVDGSDEWMGTGWSATNEQKIDVINDFQSAANWAQENNRPLHMGEFGAYNKADHDSRVLWTTYVTRKAEELGFSWAYWEFCAGFGAYNSDLGQWNTDLLNALIPVSGN